MNSIDILLAWADEKRLSQSDLARMLDVSPARITNWKTRGLPADMNAKVAAAFGRSIEELLGGEPPNRSEEAFNALSERMVTKEDIVALWLKLNPERQRRLLANAWDFVQSQAHEPITERNPFAKTAAPLPPASAAARRKGVSHRA